MLGAGLVGGGASHLAGGNFWDGFRNGAIAATLNHLLHSSDGWPPKNGDPDKVKLAELLAEQNGGDPYTYYKVLTNPDTLNNSLIDGSFNLFGLATLAPLSKIFSFFGGLFSKGAIKTSVQIGGRTNAQWSKLFGWGKNPEGALAKLNNLSKVDIQNLKQAGVKLSDVKKWRTTYSNAIGKKVGQSNLSAKYRYDLMNSIIKMW